MHRLYKISLRLLTFLGYVVWFALGVWLALATFFAAPVSVVPASAAALAILAAFILASRERFRLHRWFKTPWPQKRITTIALTAATAVSVCYFGLMRPDANQDWAPEHSRMPAIRIDGNTIHVTNVRDFKWQSDGGSAVAYEEHRYDLDALNSLDYVLCPLASFDGVAHVFVCFGFSDGQHVAISVEGRRAKGRPYRVIPSLFRQYQLIYVVGDEQDVVGLRGAIWKVPVYFYPTRTSRQKMRAIFLDMMERAHSLEDHPEYYNLVTNNCLNNITANLRRLGVSAPANLRLLFTGYSDRVAYDLGFIDTDLPFEKARRVFRVDGWMQTTPLDEEFSRRLRENLIQQVAKAGGRTDMIR